MHKGGVPGAITVLFCASFSQAARPGQHVVLKNPNGTVDRYRLTREIGRGSFSQVFHALTNSGRAAAIKLADPSGELAHTIEATFHDESRLLMKLHGSPAIGSYGIGHLEEEPGRPAHVMELAQGSELLPRDRFGQPRTRGEVAAILTQVLLALDAAHNTDARHNDIKPANIHIADDRAASIKLLDWGSAGPLTQDHKVGGVFFHAPEQWRRLYFSQSQYREQLPEPYRSTQLSTAGDPSCDLYSVGAVGLWMVTGGMTLENRQEAVAALRKILSVDERGRTLLAILERAIDYSPQKRFRTAREFIEALRPLTTTPDQSDQSRK